MRASRVLPALCPLLLCAAVPTPREHFGFTPGDDYKLADYAQIAGYFRSLAAASDRIHWIEYGKTSLGRPSYLAVISSPDNLRNLDKFKDINRRLALGRATSAEARSLAEEGRAFVWIDSGLHASEVAPAQHSPELAYQMITGESDEIRRIRDRVILLQVPVINPDGLDMIVEWYRKNVGTPYELAPLPRLYQKYAGHDNNRDWFMMNLQETRNVTRLLYHEWFPQIVYNQHQAPAFPARIFVPPYAEPLNPNIPAAVMEGINMIGAAMKERFARENKPGILSYFGYDAWWNGGLRSVPAFHNMHGILTETALHSYATPRTYTASDLPERFGNGMPTKEPTVFYERPWLGGKWGVRDAIEYMLTADFAILELTSTRTAAFLHKAWEVANANIELGRRGNPYAYIVPAAQWDPSSATEMLRRLQQGAIQIHRAPAEFSAGGKRFPAGSHVLLAAQPFRGYLLDLLEPQKYPELLTGANGPTKRPYDIAGWTLSMNMGIEVQRIDEPFKAELVLLQDELPRPEPLLDHRQNSAFLAIAEMLDRGRRVRRAADGKLLAEGDPGFDKGAWEHRPPRLAVYEPWTANMDTGWTQWLLDYYRVPYTIVHNEEIRSGNLRSRFDCILLASQTPNSMLHGYRDGEAAGRRGNGGESPGRQRPEFTGGIGLTGAAHLETFVKEGGTLITLADAGDLPLQLFGLPAHNVVSNAEASRDPVPGAFYSPGSLLRITVDTSNPLAFGMPPSSTAFSADGKAYDIDLLPGLNVGDRDVRSVARYASKSLLASGWLSGEKTVVNKHIMLDASLGRGRVVLFGFRPQFRGQSFGTFKLLLNAIYLASAKRL